MENYQLVNILLLFMVSLMLFSPSYVKWWFKSSFSDYQASEDESDQYYIESLAGLIAAWPETNCSSRTEYQQVQSKIKTNRKSFSPTPYLISKLRRYESLHRKCAGEAEKFNLLLNPNTTGEYVSSDCRFIVYINFFGLGNKMLTIASAFIYALLTDRVLLINRDRDLPELFCEPFPNTSWYVPESFPHDWLQWVEERPPYRFGKLIEDGGRCNDTLLNSPYLYVHITHSADPGDKRFFCQYEQKFLQSVPWILLRGDVYFVPNFYSMSSFREELDKMFPDPDTGFLYTSRYLFHPSNEVWNETLEYYKAHMAHSSNKNLVGIQIRPFDPREDIVNMFTDQILNCWENNASRVLPAEFRNSSTILVTSLHEVFHTRLKALESRGVKVLMPSHDEWQQTDDLQHDKKALMEIFLLSLCDDLLTSPRSTFGYVANGLAGVKPWMLRGYLTERPMCYKLPSPEPCLLLTSDQQCNCGGEVASNTSLVLGRCLDDVIMNGYQIQAVMETMH